MLFSVNSFIFCLYQVTWKKSESLLFREDAAQIFKVLIMKFMLLEIVVNSFIFCLYQVTWKKFESLLFRGDVAQIFKILIMKFILLEIVVFCQFIHILLISGFRLHGKNLNLYCLEEMLLKFLQF